MTTLHLKKSIGRSPLRYGFLLIPLALACFALSPQARAVCQDACLTNFNTVQGDDALFSLTTGSSNTANGFEALLHNTTGNNNTALGADALLSNTTGSSNTANSSFALLSNTTGNFNTATGVAALANNTIGSGNTANGFNALYSNTASFNTATGDTALFSNTTAPDNTAMGFQALFRNTIGAENTATGENALLNNTAGNGSTAVGYGALQDNNSGSSNIALGVLAGSALTTGSNNIDIGNTGKAGESQYIRIGTKGTQTHTLIAGISGVTVAGGVGVIIDTNGHLGTVVSSERFKDAIKPMDKASEAILALKPVTFRYKHELDPDGIPQFGLVAEQVEKVNPDLVARDEQGKPYTVRYEAVNAMLLNEFLKAHRKMEEQDATIAKQQKQIETLTAGLRKVSAELELNKSAPQTALNDQ